MIERLDNDYKDSLKAKDSLKVMVLRTIKSNIKLKTLDKKSDLTEEEITDIIGKEIKQRKDSITEFNKANRLDLVEKEQNELNILMEYMPTQLSEEELNEIISKVFDLVNPTSSKDIGNVMKEITPLVKGKTDMKVLMEIIKGKLSV